MHLTAACTMCPFPFYARHFVCCPKYEFYGRKKMISNRENIYGLWGFYESDFFIAFDYYFIALRYVCVLTIIGRTEVVRTDAQLI